MGSIGVFDIARHHKFYAIGNVKTLRSQLVKMRARGEMNVEEYEHERAEVTVQIYEIEERIREMTPEHSVAQFVHFAQLKLVDMASAWKIAEPEQRQRVQNLLFQDGLGYIPKSGILNRSKSSLFSVLESTGNEEGLLASPTGFEPVLSP